jgi:rhodanese-related sulfurtransferase
MMSMTKEAVLKKMKKDDTVVLNILPEEDFAKLHIKGSDSITFGQNVRSFVLAVEKKYGKEKFFVIYCANREDALASHNAVVVLKEQGFKADDYPGGIQEWAKAGFPTEGSEAMIPETSLEETEPPEVLPPQMAENAGTLRTV